jgi:uncharacterized delta-60 repeat protein
MSCFCRISPAGSLARIHLNGALDSSLNLSAYDFVRGLLLQPDGKIVIAGFFTTVGGVQRNRIARINADGTLDSGFNPVANANCRTCALQSDGRIVVGGNFTTMGGTVRNHIARVNASGSLDSGFNPNVNGNVYCVAVQADGKVLPGGTFTTVAGIAEFSMDGGVTRNFLARLENQPATERLIAPDNSRAQWQRGGTLTRIAARGPASGSSCPCQDNFHSTHLYP